jgi:hypothetical protein
MDPYVLGKDIQEIKILLRKLIDEFQQQRSHHAEERGLDEHRFWSDKQSVRTFATSEENLWQAHVASARAALDFWATYMALAGGASNNRSLSSDEVSRLMCIIRAVSFVESRHGSVVGANHGDLDPMVSVHQPDRLSLSA